jgi:hypothetical protein
VADFFSFQLQLDSTTRGERLMKVAKFVGHAALVAAVALWWANGAARAGSLTTADGNGADTFGSNDSNSGPTVVHGAEETVNVRSLAASRARLAMLRFDVSDPDTPTTNVRLKLIETQGTRNRVMQVYGLNDGADDNWDESTANYSNMPGVDNLAALGSYAMDLNEVTLLGNMNVIDNRIGGVATPQAIFSNPATLPLDNFIAQDTNGVITLFLTYDPANTDSNPDYRFATKENTAGHAPPTLIPEPASLALVVVGLALAAAGVRRRS